MVIPQKIPVVEPQNVVYARGLRSYSCAISTRCIKANGV